MIRYRLPCCRERDASDKKQTTSGEGKYCHVMDRIGELRVFISLFGNVVTWTLDMARLPVRLG